MDGFPTDAHDSDAGIQTLIGADLETATRLETEFERKYPKGSQASSIARIQNQPAQKDLYPRLSAAKPRRSWLLPLARRIAWNSERNTQWMRRLAAMMSLALEDVRRVDEPEFLELAEQAGCLATPPQFSLAYVTSMAEFTKGLEKDGPLRDPVVRAIRVLMRNCEAIYGWHHFAWPLFRSETGLGAGDPCWAARVRHDLAAMDDELRAAWLKVFDADAQQIRAGARIPTKRALAAVEHLGGAEVARGLGRWIALLRDGSEPVLSPMGVMLLRHVIVLCDAMGGDACDELLCAIARAPWGRKDELKWLETFLWASARRPEDRAFVGVEALAMNPVTATEEVRLRYEALMTVFSMEALAAAGTGVDGYPLNSDPDLAPHQQRINRLMTMGAQAASQGPYVHPMVAHHLEAIRNMPEEEITPAIRLWTAQLSAPSRYFDVGPEARAAIETMEDAILKEFAADPESLHRALVKRLDWIRAHESEIGKETVEVWRQSFDGFGCRRGLIRSALAKVGSLTKEGMLRAIRSGRRDLKVFDLCRSFVAEHGWDGEVVLAMRQWVKTLGNSHTDNLYRAKVEWFLWFEDVEPLDDAACWSHRVKRDLRAMRPRERDAWLALLGDNVYVVTDVPPKKWLKPAEKAFGKVGAASFRKRFSSWFAAFAVPEPLRLTVTGRNVLRLLIWCALIAGDPAVDEVLAGFAGAQWKTKENVRMAAQAEMAFAYVLGQRSPDRALSILEEWVTEGRAYLGSAAYRTYEGLCARAGRTAIKAKRQQ